MATPAQWTKGYGRQADADLRTFNLLRRSEVPECHKLQFLQMACEKLVKAHLCREGKDPATLQGSHAYVSKHLAVVLRDQADFENYKGSRARDVLHRARQLALEIELLAPAVKRGGRRPDNCEYPWEDDSGSLHLPLEHSFHSSQLMLMPAGLTILKLVRGAISRLLS